MNKSVTAGAPKATIDPECWAALFQPDILAPVRFLERMLRTRDPSPEKMLMFAVLEDAISAYQQGRLTTDTRESARYQEARDWLLYEKNNWPFSFERICEALDLNPNYLRKGLLRRQGILMNRPPKARVFHIVRAGRRVRKKYRPRLKRTQKLFGGNENSTVTRYLGGSK